MTRGVFSDLNVWRQESHAANLSLLQTLADSKQARMHLTTSRPALLADCRWVRESCYLSSRDAQERCAGMVDELGVWVGRWWCVQLKPAPELGELLERTPVTKRGRQLEVLQRLNVTVDDPALLHTLVSSHLLPFSPFPPPPPPPPPLQSSPAAESYDLLAVCPASDRVFLQACSVLPIDIVTFNFTEKLPFVLKFSQLSQVYVLVGSSY